MPPPVLPPFVSRSPVPSNQTTSGVVLPLCRIVVPPTDRTYWLAVGKSTCACPSRSASLDPSSPEATHTVTPSSAASCSASLIWRMPDLLQTFVSSGAPQLIDRTPGSFV